MTTEEIIGQIKQARLTLRDERIIEQLIFAGDGCVVANTGEKNGPVCAPLLRYQIDGDAIVISAQGDKVWFKWESLELDDKTLTVQCEGLPKVFNVEPAEPRKRHLP